MITLDGIIFSIQEYGGISTYFHELHKRFIHANINMELLLFNNQNTTQLNDNIRTTKCIQMRFAERYRRCITSLNTSLFHSSYYRLPASKKILTITTVHDFIYERFSSGIKRWIHSLQKFEAIRESSAVICISENSRNDLFEFFPKIESSRVIVIYNGVSNSFFPLEINDVSVNKKEFVLFVGSRFGYKNFFSVIKSLSLLVNINLICVGGGAFSTSELTHMEKNIPDRYYHAGFVDNDRLNYLYNTALCLLYPSSYEGFGIPVLEAMRAGCPVIAVNSSSIPEVAGNSAILLESAEPELIANAIQQVSDVTFRDTLRHKGFQQSSKFSWDDTFKRAIDVYENVLGYTL